MGKRENLYTKEFIEYYHSLGFEKIIIFDNNDINDEQFYYILKDYIKNSFVEIIDIRGLKSTQIAAYNYCYKKYNELFDNNYSSINNYIYNKRFEKCQAILFNLLFYDDNNLEKYDGRKIIERFKHPKKQSSLVKSIIRGNIKNLIIPTTHIMGINIDYYCNPNGKRIYPKTFYASQFQKDCLKSFKKNLFFISPFFKMLKNLLLNN